MRPKRYRPSDPHSAADAPEIAAKAASVSPSLIGAHVHTVCSKHGALISLAQLLGRLAATDPYDRCPSDAAKSSVSTHLVLKERAR